MKKDENPHLYISNSLKHMLIEQAPQQEIKDNYSDMDLMIYSYNGDIKGIMNCIDSGCNINAQDNNGNTSLMIAIANHQTNAAIKLINLGANLTIRNNTNHTALMISAFHGEKEVAERLVERGVTGLEGRDSEVYARRSGNFTISTHLNIWFESQDKIKELVKDTQENRDKITSQMVLNKLPISLPYREMILATIKREIKEQNDHTANNLGLKPRLY